MTGRITLSNMVFYGYHGDLPEESKLGQRWIVDLILTLDIAAAVRSMTTLPATVYGLKDRGQLRPGAFADVLIFDLARVNDAATYDKPHQLSEGFDDIIVNGELARRNGRFTTALAGRVLRPERH